MRCPRLLPFSLLWLLTFIATFASAAVINSTTVAGNQLTITGTGFSGTPLTVTFNGQQLTLVSSTPTQIVATLNPVPPPGTYRLVVRAGKPAATSYVAISAAPNIVAQVALTGQTAPIPTTTLFTPSATGMYRLSTYGTITNPVAVVDGYWLVILNWTDDAGTENCTGMVNGCLAILVDITPPSAAEQRTFVVNANAGAPVSYSVSPGGYDLQGSVYELFITVEQLQ
jgi:hypothetical protein